MLKNDTEVGTNDPCGMFAKAVEFIAIRTEISAIWLPYKVKGTEDSLDPNGVILN